jgi:hypothetical protein
MPVPGLVGHSKGGPPRMPPGPRAPRRQLTDGG